MTSSESKEEFCTVILKVKFEEEAHLKVIVMILKMMINGLLLRPEDT